MAAHSILPTASAPFARKTPSIKIETLVPDFRGRMDRALDILTVTPPDVFNHNLENVPRLYRQVCPGADYNWSLKLLERFKEAHPEILTKSGLMVGLGETNDEIIEVMRDLRRHGVTMLTCEASICSRAVTTCQYSATSARKSSKR